MNSDDTLLKPLVIVATTSEFHNKYLTNELTMAGVRVLSCGSGEDALVLATTNRPSIVMIEPEIHGINGIDVALSLQSNRETSRIFIMFLLLAGSKYPDFASRFRRGTIGFLTYPYGLTEVKGHVCRALDYLAQQSEGGA